MIKKVLLILSIASSLQSKTIIWDLGEVLITTDKLGVARTIGISHFLARLFLDWKSPNIKDRFFEVLTLMDTDPEKKWHAHHSDNSMLPPIMSQWLAGRISGHEIINRSKTHIDRLHAEKFFISEREKVLIERTIEASFTPEILARNSVPIDEGIALLKECKEARDEGGEPHRFIVLSNWEPLSFDLVYEANQDLFKQFDNIIVSGHIDMIKPDKKIFQYMLKAYNLDPDDCIFIDDQEANAITARECSIETIVCKDHDFETVRARLVELGILASPN